MLAIVPWTTQKVLVVTYFFMHRSRDWSCTDHIIDHAHGWHHRLDGREFLWTLGIGNRQGGLGEKAMATQSSTLAWKIPWMGEPGRLQSMGSLGVGHDWATSLSLSCIGVGNGNALQYSCLKNPRDGGAWWAVVCGVAQSRTRLRQLSSSSSSSREAWRAAIHGVTKSRTRLNDWTELNFKIITTMMMVWWCWWWWW